MEFIFIPICKLLCTWELLSEQTVRNVDNRTDSRVESIPPPHSTVCLECRRLLIFSAAILSKIMFLVKQPSVVCRVLDSDLCPPHDVLHDRNLSLFYDALYYPQYHLHVFSTAENFCSWLQSSLTSHRELCSVQRVHLCIRLRLLSMTVWHCHDVCAISI